MIAAAAVILGYLVGSLPTGLIVIRLVKGIDIRQYGSGNIGAINVFRVAGLPTAVLVLAVDMVKGAFPVLLARTWGQTPLVAVLVGLAAIAGHNWSVFLRFAGGKGIATSFGVLLALSPASAGVAAGVWLLVAAVTRYASVASLLAITTVPVVMGVRREPREHVAFGVVALMVAVYRHRANLGRLLRGTELKVTDRL